MIEKVEKAEVFWRPDKEDLNNENLSRVNPTPNV